MESASILSYRQDSQPPLSSPPPAFSTCTSCHAGSGPAAGMSRCSNMPGKDFCQGRINKTATFRRCVSQAHFATWRGAHTQQTGQTQAASITYLTKILLLVIWAPILNLISLGLLEGSYLFLLFISGISSDEISHFCDKSIVPMSKQCSL